MVVKRKAVVLILLGWAVAVFIALSLPSKCPDQCRGAACTLMGCTPGITSVPGLIAGAVVALTATGIGFWFIMRRETSEGDT